MPHTQVAIVWASFAWLSSVLALRKRRWDNVSITLFDKRKQFTYIPWLHEAVLDTQRLESMQFDLATYYPEYHQADITTIKPHCLETTTWDTRTFDYCIIATGARTKFFGNDQWEEVAYKVAYPDDIPKLNAALSSPSTNTITVVWWGYTGIEIASVIAQRKRTDQHLRVVHGSDRLFQRLSTYISEKSLTRLQEHDVEVLMDSRVTDITDTTITVWEDKVIDSDVTIVSRWITANDTAHRPQLTFENDYQANETDRIYTAWDVAIHGLYTTAHNAMIEWRRIGYLIADKIAWKKRKYSSLTNRDKLAIALWSHDGIFTNWKKGLYIPGLIGLAKWIIEKRVLIEFKRRVMLPI